MKRKTFKIITSCAVLLIVACSARAPIKSYRIEEEVRPGVLASAWIKEPAGSIRGSLLLFPGGIWPDPDNFVNRTRPLLIERGYKTISVKKPDDKRLINNRYRKSQKEQDDVKVLLEKSSVVKEPLSIVGFSRGATSALNILEDGQLPISKVVLLSPTVDSKVFKKVLARIPQALQSKILVVYHQLDRCDGVTPEKFQQAFSDYPGVTVKELTGGKVHPLHRICGPFSYHGFEGIEGRVIDFIQQWIKNAN